MAAAAQIPLKRLATLREAVSHPSVRWIGAGWAGFVAENLVLSHNREEIITALGERNYHRAYNFLSTSACAAIASHSRTTPSLASASSTHDGSTIRLASARSASAVKSPR